MSKQMRDPRCWLAAAVVAVVSMTVAFPVFAQDDGAVEEKPAPKVYREKTKITVEGRAEADGVVELVVEPAGSEPNAVRLNVLKKTKAKKLAKELATQLEFALGDGYKVKRWGDKEIRLTTKGKAAAVSITLGAQQLPGVGITIGKL
jgi:hypothetical protein